MVFLYLQVLNQIKKKHKDYIEGDVRVKMYYGFNLNIGKENE